MKFNFTKLLNPALFAGLLLSALSVNAQQTGTISGRVSDSSANLNLEGVIVSIAGTSIEDITDGSGQFTLRNVPTGTQTIEFNYVGLESISRTVSVISDQRSLLNLDMAQEVVELSEMQIYGSLIGQSRAINLQKTSATLKNVVAADAFGRFPDQNAAEILGRLPGVSVELDQGEGRYVIVRGIDPDLSNISIDGVSIPSPENDTRRVALDVIPSDILDTLEVTKAVTPDMDGDTIGGNVNIKTKSAFDFGDTVLQGTVQGQYSHLVDDYSGKVNVTYGDINEDSTIGWITSVSYQERDFGSDNFEVGGWSEEEGPSGGEAFFAQDFEFREYTITRERLGFSGALEFKPEDDAQYFVRAIFNNFSDQEYRQGTFVPLEEGEITSLGVQSASVEGVVETEKELKDRYEEQTIYSLSSGGEIHRGNWTFDFGLAFSKAEEEEPDALYNIFKTDEDSGQNYSYEFDGNYSPNLRYLGGDADPFTAGNFLFDESVLEDNATEEEEWSAHFNARKELDRNGSPAFVKFGLKYRAKEKFADNSVFENDDEPDDLTLANFEGMSDRYPHFNGPGGGYLTVDAHAIRDFFNNNRSAFAMELNEEDSMIEDYQTNEDVLAGYLMGGVTSGNWQWTGGVRVEQTEFESTGMDAVFDEDGDFDPDASFVSTASNDYTDILPGLHARYSADENSVFRASLHKSLARPKFSDSANRSEINIFDDEEIFEGNPFLDPYQSWNLDLSYEYYFSSLGVFSVSGFAKKIDDFIFLSKSEIPHPDELGETVDFVTPLNGESADVRGIELAYIQNFDAVEGLSLYTNISFIDSEANLGAIADRDESLTIDFPGTSDLLGTIALTYEFQGFFVRLAGTHRSSYLQEVGGEPAEDEYIDDHFQWDLSTSYQLNDHITLFAEVVNLDDEPFRAYFGNTSRMRQFEEYSWFANFGVKWNL